MVDKAISSAVAGYSIFVALVRFSSLLPSSEFSMMSEPFLCQGLKSNNQRYFRYLFMF